MPVSKKKSVEVKPSERIVGDEKEELGEIAVEDTLSEPTKGGVPAGPAVENGELQATHRRF